ncbi:hypothetical protein ACGFYE_24140 [Streptomyces zaomyceticus]|uniref:hypothetical protein n=1 Tax=Streptomyces zaomyceticus TaxID=68286 RepID=UPI00372330AF
MGDIVDMGSTGTTDLSRGRLRAERLVEGLTVAVASVLSCLLLAGPVSVFVTTAWQLATGTGITAFSRVAVPVILLVLLTLPLVLGLRVFRSGRRKGRDPMTAAVPATLSLLAGSVVPFGALVLVFVFAHTS